MRLFLTAFCSAAVASASTWALLRHQAADAGQAQWTSHTQVRVGPAYDKGSGDSASENRPDKKSADRWSSLRDASGKLPDKAMEQALEKVLAESDPLLAMEAFTSLLRELTPENAAAAWTLMSSRADGPEGMKYLPLLAHAWGSMDGPAAIAAMNGKDRESMMARMSAMGGWAAKDSTAAMSWLREKELLAGEGKGSMEGLRELKMGLLRGLVSAHPDEAMRLLPDMNERDRSTTLAMLAREQFQKGMDGAEAWLGGIRDPEMKQQAMESLMRQYSEKDPAKAAAWLATQGNPDAHQAAVGAIARQWADKDPAGAIAWLSKLPAGGAQNEAWEDAMRSWSKRDPMASSTYLNQMPPGEGRDAAVSSLSRSIARSDPDAAIQWASTIKDPAARESTLVRTAQLWMSRDETAARQWISTGAFSPEVQEQMMTPLPQREGRPARADRPAGGFP